MTMWSWMLVPTCRQHTVRAAHLKDIIFLAHTLNLEVRYGLGLGSTEFMSLLKTCHCLVAQFLYSIKAVHLPHEWQGEGDKPKHWLLQDVATCF